MKILITICARGGSKGIPGKNVKMLLGKPLIYYTIKNAFDFKEKYKSVDIALSTDSAEILKVSSNFGLTSDYRRPDFLSGDDVGKIDAIKDVVTYYENKNEYSYDYVLDLDVTSPLRNLDDLSAAYDLIRKDDNALTLFSVSPCNRNPYFNMVEKQSNGYFDLAKRLDTNILTRQSAPKVYDMNASFYFYKHSFFKLKYDDPVTDHSLVYVVPHMCFDLDHPIDFVLLSFLLKNKELDFVL